MNYLPPEKLPTHLLEAQLAMLEAELALLEARETLILTTKEYITRLETEIAEREKLAAP